MKKLFFAVIFLISACAVWADPPELPEQQVFNVMYDNLIQAVDDFTEADATLATAESQHKFWKIHESRTAIRDKFFAKGFDAVTFNAYLTAYLARKEPPSCSGCQAGCWGAYYTCTNGGAGMWWWQYCLMQRDSCLDQCPCVDWEIQ